MTIEIPSSVKYFLLQNLERQLSQEKKLRAFILGSALIIDLSITLILLFVAGVARIEGFTYRFAILAGLLAMAVFVLLFYSIVGTTVYGIRKDKKAVENDRFTYRYATANRVVTYGNTCIARCSEEEYYRIDPGCAGAAGVELLLVTIRKKTTAYVVHQYR